MADALTMVTQVLGNKETVSPLSLYTILQKLA